MFSLYTYHSCGSITASYIWTPFELHWNKRGQKADLFPLASKLIYKILYVICYIKKKIFNISVKPSFIHVHRTRTYRVSIKPIMYDKISCIIILMYDKIASSCCTINLSCIIILLYGKISCIIILSYGKISCITILLYD